MRPVVPLALWWLAAVPAQELPVQFLSVQQGLPHARVNCCWRARSGHLWIGTWEGLCRFDGHRFVSFDRRDGLPNALVDAVVDIGDDVWIGTHGAGLLRLRGGADAVDLERLRRFSLGSDRTHGIVLELFVDSLGRLWASTETSIVVCRDPRADEPVFTTVIDGLLPGGGRLFERAAGVVAAAGRDAVFVADEQATVMQRVATFAVPADAAGACAINCEAWIARRDGVFALRDGEPGTALEQIAAAPAGTVVTAMCRARDGGCWLGTNAGLFHLAAGTAGGAAVTPAMPLHVQWIESLHADREGDLWVGLHAAGLARVLPVPVVDWTSVSGLSGAVSHLLEEASGRFLAATETGGLCAIENDRIVPLAGLQEAPFANVGMRCVVDRDGGLFVGTDHGLFHHRGPRLDRVGLRALGAADGVPDGGVFSLCGSAEGGVWCATEDCLLLRITGDGDAVAVRERIDLRAAGVPVPPRDMLRTRDGALWLAPYFGLWRLRGGVAEALAPNGIADPAINARCLLDDGAGGLWVGLRTAGLVHCADPAAPSPRFATIPAVLDAPSTTFFRGARSPDGATWFATGRGLWRLAADRRSARTFATADGLPSDAVICTMCDRLGRVWAGTFAGAARIGDATSVPDRAPPRARFGEVRVAGRRLPRGIDGRMEPFELDAANTNVDVELAAVDFRPRPPRCRYRLDGGDWSPLMSQRALSLAGLAPGSYLLEVEAIGCDGTVSPERAALAFTVLPPLWRRPWMLAAYGVAAATIAYGFHRVRLQRALALERVRLRIAGDLHDDLGAGLAQIAILAEVGRQRASGDSAARLGEVAGIARELRAGMADLVWTIDPAHDRLDDLVRRLRQVANHLFDAEGVELVFRAPDDAALRAVSLPAERRRHWLLFGKEALANVARHARARRVEVTVEVAGEDLALTIRDDGVGFDPARTHDGNGLPSLRVRAEALGLSFVIESAPGAGTRIHLGPA